MVRTNRIVPGHPDFENPQDHHKYIHMAMTGPFRFHIAPYCWRVGVPFLASWLPFELLSNFSAISFIGVWAAGCAMWYLAQAFGHGPPLRLFALLLFFSISPACRFPIMDPWLPDGLALGILAWAFVCLKTGRYWQLAVLLALGAAVKESTLFIAPLCLTLGPRTTWRPRGLAVNLAPLLPAILVTVALRSAIPAYNADAKYREAISPRLYEVDNPVETGMGDEINTSYDYWTRLRIIGQYRIRTLSLQTIPGLTIGVYGLLPVALILLGISGELNLFARVLPFLLLVYFQILLASETMRLLAFGVPAIVLLSLPGAVVLSRVLSAPTRILCILPLSILALNLAWTDRIDARLRWQALGLFAAMIVVWGVGRLVARGSFRANRAEPR